MAVDPLKFAERFSEIVEIYREVKAIMILAENVDEQKDAYLGPVNEIRNTLDHITRSFSDSEHFELEFSEAKEHLYRAGYDAYEILAVNLADKIGLSFQCYTPEIISNVYPNYFKEIRPVLLDLKVKLAEARSKKTINSEIGIKCFEIYNTSIRELVRLSKITDMLIPDLEEEKKRLQELALLGKKENASEKRKEKVRDRTVSFSFGILFAIIGIGLKYAYDLYFSHPTNPKPIINSVNVDSSLRKTSSDSEKLINQ